MTDSEFKFFAEDCMQVAIEIKHFVKERVREESLSIVEYDVRLGLLMNAFVCTHQREAAISLAKRIEATFASAEDNGNKEVFCSACKEKCYTHLYRTTKVLCTTCIKWYTTLCKRDGTLKADTSLARKIELVFAPPYYESSERGSIRGYNCHACTGFCYSYTYETLCAKCLAWYVSYKNGII